VIWGYIIGSFFGAMIGTFIGSQFTKYRDKRDRRKFLRYLKITYPNAKVVEAISISDTDKQALDNVERRIRDASRNL
jgi:hypothetical protein